MVSRLAALSALIAAIVVPAAPACGQDIMGQIETQVAGVVSRTTGGIVTIEDLRGIELDDVGRMSRNNFRRGLRHQLVDALNRLSDADIQISVLKSAVKSGSVLADAVKSRNAIAAELDGYRAELAKSTDVARLRVDIDNTHLRWLNDKRTHLEDEITQLTKTISHSAPRIAPLLATKTAINAQIAEVDSTLASDLQKLGADPMMRTDIPKAGTGFCIGDGFVVTTADVLDGMVEPVVVTTDGARIRTRVIGVDIETNIGVLHLNAELSLPVLVLGDSSTVSVGNFAICIGNQSGTQNAVSLNTISGIRSDGMFSGRRFYPRLLQIAGNITAGNSGAPLMNSRGDVIGMVVAVPVGEVAPPPYATSSSPRSLGQEPFGSAPPQDSHRGGTAGVQPPGLYYRSTVTNAAYAVPINCARPIVDDLRSGKGAQHCWIGISVTTKLTQAYNDKTLDLNRTVTVNAVYPNSPALKVGVQKGDEIISINGRPIHEDVDVRIVSMLSRPGDPITIILNRQNGTKVEPMTLQATADLRPATFPRPLPTKTP